MLAFIRKWLLGWEPVAHPEDIQHPDGIPSFGFDLAHGPRGPREINVRPLLQIETTVGEKNQVTVPGPVAERHGIEPGQRVVIVDAGAENEFTVRILPRSHAGALADVFARTTDENVEFVRIECANG